MTVRRVERLGPHLVRIVAGGPGYDSFRDNTYTDKYVKVYFTRPELGLTAPYDFAKLRRKLPKSDQPVTRTYTVRWSDPAARELAIDFVVHGDEGLAGPWAARARPGDRISFKGPGGRYAPDPTADWHLLAGDDTALPAIGAALEALRPRARGVAFLEVDSEKDQIELKAPSGVELRWLFRNGAAPGAAPLLPAAVRDYDWPEGRVHVFAHGEAGSIRQLRGVFNDRALEKKQVSVSGYWSARKARRRAPAPG
ncbi:siderophore-interacting protein [Zafaria sp. Z1313]|uniref:siderophore-interacting protein n=1 Tax=Zafaria sp. Z1313 TaxID=3423202 RepID=UPI003D30347A